MKKITAMLLLLTLFLCGCGGSGKQGESNIALSTEPVQSALNDQQSANDAPIVEATEPVEYYENGSIRKEVIENPDTGEYWMMEYYENGNISKSIFNDPTTGKYAEWEYYEDGTQKIGSYGNHTTGEHHQEEYYESGQMKYQKQQYPNQIFEGCYDEEGYYTYTYSQMPMPGAKKGLYRTEECFADENGKLIKVILNGEVHEDSVWLAQQAHLKNFRE